MTAPSLIVLFCGFLRLYEMALLVVIVALYPVEVAEQSGLLLLSSRLVESSFLMRSSYRNNTKLMWQ